MGTLVEFYWLQIAIQKKNLYTFLSSVSQRNFSVASRPDKKWKWCNFKEGCWICCKTFLSLSFFCSKNCVRVANICCVTREKWEKMRILSTLSEDFSSLLHFPPHVIKLWYSFSNINWLFSPLSVFYSVYKE